MNEKIKAWLDSEEKDYEAGVNLLTKFSKNRTLAKFLGQKQNQSNTEKLIYELGKLAGKTLTPDEISEMKPLVGLGNYNNNVFAAPDEAKKSDLVVDLKIIPTQEALDQMEAEKAKLFNKRCQLSNTLADIETDEERAKVTAEILGLQESYNALAQKQRTIQELGGLPEPDEAADAPALPDKAALIVTRDNLRSQRSKAKGAVKSDPDNVAKQEKLAKIQIELTAIEDKIKMLG